MITRREFVKSTTASVAAAAVAESAAAAPARAAEILVQRSVKPVVISDYSGYEFTNGGPENAVEPRLPPDYRRQGRARCVDRGRQHPASSIRSKHGIGYGALPNADGIVQLDASLHARPDEARRRRRRIEGVRTPSLVAKAVMDTTDHHLLVGKGAQEFARAMGFKVEDDLNTEKSRKAVARVEAPRRSGALARSEGRPSARRPRPSRDIEAGLSMVRDGLITRRQLLGNDQLRRHQRRTATSAA